jgi:hypothetical protein
VPSFGIIDDGGPQAFTYGRAPNDARVVISRGVLELLDPAEVEAVVAHEPGHARSWDMVLMTIVGDMVASPPFDIMMQEAYILMHENHGHDRRRPASQGQATGGRAVLHAQRRGSRSPPKSVLTATFQRPATANSAHHVPGPRRSSRCRSR